MWILLTTNVLFAAERQPNIVVLFADDLGYGELGCQGNPEIPTPHIDAIADNGVRFTSGYVAGPNCSPSRAGLLTGRIPTRFGYEFNPTGAKNEEPGFGLPPSEITIAECLHDAGYTNGLIGKYVDSYEFPDGRLEFRSKGVLLPYSSFDKDQRVTHTAITESKRLGAVLEHIKEQQEKMPPKKQRIGKQRTRYQPNGRRNDGWSSKLAQRAKKRAEAGRQRCDV